MPRGSLPPLSTSYRKAGYPGEQSCIGRLCNCICNAIFAALMAVGIYYIWDMMGRPNGQDALDFVKNFNVSDFEDVLDNITDAVWDNGFDEDPYVGDNTTNIWKRATSNGLSLVLQNALDDGWQTEFASAFEDWQESDVLELTAIQVEVDNGCTRVEGLMKVCNGNFGETGWLGINEIELEYTTDSPVGYIVSSVAKMNEHYLHNAAYEQRQYTMCHEIGHGFGLPHTDESFNNQDQGNCLDYTHTPENNLHPGEVNMNRLKSIYGWTQDDDYSNNDDTIAAGDDAATDDAASTDDLAMDDAVAMQQDDSAAWDDQLQYGDDNVGRRLRTGRQTRRRVIVRYVPAI